MDISKIENDLRKKGIKPSKILPPLDRLLLKLKIINMPTTFHSFLAQFFILSTYWFISFPLLCWLLFSIILFDPFWFKITSIGINDLFFVFFVHFMSSIGWAAFTTYFSQRSMKKLNLPPWEYFKNLE